MSYGPSVSLPGDDGDLDSLTPEIQNSILSALLQEISTSSDLQI